MLEMTTTCDSVTENLDTTTGCQNSKPPLISPAPAPSPPVPQAATPPASPGDAPKKNRGGAPLLNRNKARLGHRGSQMAVGLDNADNLIDDDLARVHIELAAKH